MERATASPYALDERDYIWLARSTISRAVADAFCFRVDDVEGAAQVGQKLTALRPMRGIIFRYFSPWGGHERERRLRRDVPDMEAGGKESGKYIGPPDRPPLLFFPLLAGADQFRTWLEDSTLPIVFVEGEKKALALMRIALANFVDRHPPFVVIGLAGVWCWKRKDGPLPDLDLIPWRCRRVSIFFDSNAHTNSKVRGARQALADELHYNRGAKVCFAEMPRDCGLNGPDDLAYAQGDEAVLDCLALAQPAVRPTAQPQRETIEERIKRGAFLRAAVADAQVAPDASELAKQTLGTKRWRRLAALWAQAGKLEAEERDLLFTLHALSEGASEFEFYYAQLYKLLFHCDGSELDEEGRLTSSARQRIRRRFDNLEKAEQRCGMQFAEIRAGYKDDEGCHPSRIRLLSLDYVEQVESLALTDPQYARGKRAAFERAIGRFVQFKTGEPLKRHHKPPRNPFKEIEDGWSRVEGALRATVERMRAEGYEEWAIWQDMQKHVPAEFIAFIRSEPLSTKGWEKAAAPAEVKPYHEEIEVSPDLSEALILPSGEAQKSAACGPVSGQIKGFKFETLKSPQMALDATHPFADFRISTKISPQSRAP